MFLHEMKHFLFALLIMAFIFGFSSMPGDESAVQHSIVIDWFAYIGIDLYKIFGVHAVWWVRKTAHFVIFGALSVSLFYGFFKNKVLGAYYYAVIITFLYAISDELHQYFVPGRVASWKDVMIDTLGAIFFLLMIKAANFFWLRLGLVKNKIISRDTCDAD